MTLHCRSLTVLTAALLMSAVPFAASAQEAVTFERLTNPEPENWLSVYGNYEGYRYSALDEINKDTIGQLKLAFATPLSQRAGLGGNLQSAPLVDDGFLYTTDLTNAVVKIDVSTGTAGTQVWRVETTPAESQGRNQGVALWGNNVYSVTNMGTLLAIDRDSGEVLWEKRYAVDGEGFNASPLALENAIIIGQARGDSGTRGYILAADPETGEELWRFYVVPEPGQPGSETWPQDNDSWMTGGGGIWVTPTYDVESNRILLGTGNPAPAFDPEFRAGDNLYTSSIVALNADTGAMDWYFQYAPNNSHEVDEVSPHIVYDQEIDGELRKVVGHFSRLGQFYTFDRTNGQFLSATPAQTDITWTAGVDPKTGLPVEYNPNEAVQRYVLNAERGTQNSWCGGIMITGTWAPAYDPERKRVYNTSPDSSCYDDVETTFEVQPVEERFGRQGLGSPLNLRGENHRVNATDAITGEIVASTDIDIESRSSVLATGGGLIFFGDSTGTFQAYDSDTLEQVWSINLGGQILSAPISYAVDGKQFIAVQTGGMPTAGGFFGAPMGPNSSNLFVFAL